MPRTARPEHQSGKNVLFYRKVPLCSPANRCDPSHPVRPLAGSSRENPLCHHRGRALLPRPADWAMFAAACRRNWPSSAMSRSSSCRRFARRCNSGRPIEPTGVRSRCRSAARLCRGTFLRSSLPDGDEVPVYLVHQPQYYDRPELYRENGHDYKDNCERFVFFCRAALEAITTARPRHRAGPLPRLDVRRSCRRI